KDQIIPFDPRNFEEYEQDFIDAKGTTFERGFVYRSPTSLSGHALSEPSPIILKILLYEADIKYEEKKEQLKEYLYGGINAAKKPIEYSIVLRDDGDEISESSYVLISAVPEMPSLSVEAVSKNTESVKVKFRLKIEYRRDIRQDEDFFPEEGWYETTLNEEWNIDFGNKIRGGRATLYAQVGDGKDTVTFHIRGTNPTEQSIKDYISEQNDDNIWFLTRLIRQESTYRQFHNGTNYGSNWGDRQGCPLWGPPHGWGLMQLDVLNGGQRPTAQELWNWKANVDRGYNFLNGEKRNMVNGNMNSNFRLINDWLQNFPDYPVLGHADQMEGDNTTSITFTHADSE